MIEPGWRRTLATLLVKTRRSRRLTQLQLTEALGSNQAWLSQVESGVVPTPAFETYARICEALGIGLAVTVTVDGQPTTLVIVQPEGQT